MRLALIALLACSTVWSQIAPPTKSTATKKAAPKAASKASGAAAKMALPDLMRPESLKAKSPGIYIVRLETSKGNVDLRVVRAWAPIGAERFYNLVRAGYYDNNYFFRVLPFMAQVGISSRPSVNSIWADRTMFDDRPVQTNKRGTVSFASTGSPNSRSTQFFINKKDENIYLDQYKFAVFAEVVEGMEVVDQIYGGYGEPPIQGDLVDRGDAIIKAQYPRMDKIVKATILTVVEP